MYVRTYTYAPRTQSDRRDFLFPWNHWSIHLYLRADYGEYLKVNLHQPTNCSITYLIVPCLPVPVTLQLFTQFWQNWRGKLVDKGFKCDWHYLVHFVSCFETWANHEQTIPWQDKNGVWQWTLRATFISWSQNTWIEIQLLCVDFLTTAETTFLTDQWIIKVTVSPSSVIPNNNGDRSGS